MPPWLASPLASIAGIAGTVLLGIASAVLGFKLLFAYHDIDALNARIDGPTGYVKQIEALQAANTTFENNETVYKNTIMRLNDDIADFKKEGDLRKAAADKVVRDLAATRDKAERLQTEILNMKSSGNLVLDADLYILKAIGQ